MTSTKIDMLVEYGEELPLEDVIGVSVSGELKQRAAEAADALEECSEPKQRTAVQLVILKELFFSHKSISSSFRDHRHLGDAVTRLINCRMSEAAVKELGSLTFRFQNVRGQDKKIVIRGNRRLAALRLAAAALGAEYLRTKVPCVEEWNSAKDKEARTHDDNGGSWVAIRWPFYHGFNRLHRRGDVCHCGDGRCTCLGPPTAPWRRITAAERAAGSAARQQGRDAAADRKASRQAAADADRRADELRAARQAAKAASRSSAFDDDAAAPAKSADSSAAAAGSAPSAGSAGAAASGSSAARWEGEDADWEGAAGEFKGSAAAVVGSAKRERAKWDDDSDDDADDIDWVVPATGQVVKTDVAAAIVASLADMDSSAAAGSSSAAATAGSRGAGAAAAGAAGSGPGAAGARAGAGAGTRTASGGAGAAGARKPWIEED